VRVPQKMHVIRHISVMQYELIEAASDYYSLNKIKWPNKTKPIAMIIDNQSAGRAMCSKLIAGVDKEIEILTFSNGMNAVDFALENEVDLVLIEHRISGIDGIGILRDLRKMYTVDVLPIAVTTVVIDSDLCHMAFDAGATDFLVRPINVDEGRARCRSMLNMRRSHVFAMNYIDVLKNEIHRLGEEIRESDNDAALRFERIARIEKSRPS
jgi:two-component system response regulator RpfG